MSHKLFFGRKSVLHSQYKALADGIDVSLTKKRNVVVTATLVNNFVEDLCRLFNITPTEIVSLTPQ